jgi:hypothetical protein
VQVLNREIEIARVGGFECDLSTVISAANWNRDETTEEPWYQAEKSVERLREVLGIDIKPMSNRDLTALAHTESGALDVAPPYADLKYGLRLRNLRGSGNRLTLRTRGTANRRFELGRAIGDTIPYFPLSLSARPPHVPCLCLANHAGRLLVQLMRP